MERRRWLARKRDTSPDWDAVKVYAEGLDSGEVIVTFDCWEPPTEFTGRFPTVEEALAAADTFFEQNYDGGHDCSRAACPPAVEYLEEVRRYGTWLYDGTVPVRARLIRRNWDVGHDPDCDEDPPSMGPDGSTYCVESAHISDSDVFTVPTCYCLTEEEAIERGKSFPGVQWDNDSG